MRSITFHKSPITKCIILFTTLSSLVNTLMIILVNGSSLFRIILRALSVPLGTRWMILITILYWTRPLERMYGSAKYMKLLISSAVFSCSVLISCTALLSEGHSFKLPPSSLLYALVGAMVTTTLLRTRASHARSVYGIRVSSHLLLIAFTLLLVLLSNSSILHPLCGMSGSLVTLWGAPLPIPQSLFEWAARIVSKATDDKPPHFLSGATLTVQRQQRMDWVEGYLLNLQQPHGFHLARGAHYVPSDFQVQQLSQMGFRPEECRQALMASNGNIAFAIQLLTTNRSE